MSVERAGDAGTVMVRLQVIDVEPIALDLVVPTYLPAKDLTQRIARDANLGAFWADGTRRKFWLRARGRLLGEDERLQDLGVGSGELIHILPQPPEGGGVIERVPEYPPNQGYRGGNLLVMFTTAFSTVLFASLWSLGLTVEGDLVYATIAGLIPSLATALLATSTTRHLFGPQGTWRIPLVGMVFFLSLFVLVYIPALLLGVEPLFLGVSAAAGLLAGVGGVIMGYLAWLGAVEPLPAQPVAAAVVAAQSAVAPCAICGGDVALEDMEIRHDCGYGCGRVFHAGCFRARAAIAPEGQCAACGFQPGG